MRRHTLILIIPIVLSFLTTTTQAGERNLKFTIGGGLTLGGETLTTAVYTDDSTTDIDTGDLVHVYAGLTYDIPESPYQVRTSLGYHFDSAGDSDTTLSFDRYPLEILGFIKTDKFRYGAGISYHLSPVLEDERISRNTDFKNAPGLVLEGGFNMANVAWLDVRYVFIKYQEDESDEVFGDIDGDHFGVYLSASF